MERGWLIVAVSAEVQGRECRGTGVITVDNPVVIAIYLQFILPSYHIGTGTSVMDLMQMLFQDR